MLSWIWSSKEVTDCQNNTSDDTKPETDSQNTNIQNDQTTIESNAENQGSEQAQESKLYKNPKLAYLDDLEHLQANKNLADMSETSYNQKFVVAMIRQFLAKIDKTSGRPNKEKEVKIFMDFLVEHRQFIHDEPKFSKAVKDKFHEFAKDNFKLEWHYFAIYGEKLPA